MMISAEKLIQRFDKDWYTAKEYKIARTMLDRSLQMVSATSSPAAQGKKIREARERKGMKQYQLAAEMKCSQSQIWKIEKGLASVPEEMTDRFNSVLGVEL